MRDLIVHAFTWALHHLLPARGRHRAPELPPPAAPGPAVPVSPWCRPWTGPSAETARAVFTADAARGLDPERREGFYAVAWAELGVDYPYTGPGATR